MDLLKYLTLIEIQTSNFLSGENAQAEAVINNGVIESVIVLNAGSNYNSPPDIDISGDGFGAVLTPILSLTELFRPSSC